MAAAWMDELIAAHEEGRVPPGAGPLYTRRVFPTVLPVSRKELRARGLGRAGIDALYVPVTQTLLLPRPASEIARALDGDTPHIRRLRRHRIPGLRRALPRGLGDDAGLYGHDIVSRARAHWMKNPTAMVGGWAALAMHGLLYWADAAPVVLHSCRSSPLSPSRQDSRAPVIRAWPKNVAPVYPDPLVPGLAAVPPEIAVAQCLASVLKGSHSWFVAGGGDLDGLSVREVRAVQLLDAVRQCTVLTTEDLLAGCARRVDATVARKLTALSDPGAQSPQETLLRLVVRDLLPPEHAWTSQVPVSWGPRAKDRTVLDLACTELKVGLYYDGATHTATARRTKDFVQIQELKDLGWEVVRADKGLLHADRGRFLRQVNGAVARARASTSG